MLNYSDEKLVNYNKMLLLNQTLLCLLLTIAVIKINAQNHENNQELIDNNDEIVGIGGLSRAKFLAATAKARAATNLALLRARAKAKLFNPFLMQGTPSQFNSENDDFVEEDDSPLVGSPHLNLDGNGNSWNHEANAEIVGDYLPDFNQKVPKKKKKEPVLGFSPRMRMMEDIPHIFELYKHNDPILFNDDNLRMASSGGQKNRESQPNSLLNENQEFEFDENQEINDENNDKQVVLVDKNMNHDEANADKDEDKDQNKDTWLFESVDDVIDGNTENPINARMGNEDHKHWIKHDDLQNARVYDIDDSKFSPHIHHQYQQNTWRSNFNKNFAHNFRENSNNDKWMGNVDGSQNKRITANDVMDFDDTSHQSNPRVAEIFNNNENDEIKSLENLETDDSSRKADPTFFKKHKLFGHNKNTPQAQVVHQPVQSHVHISSHQPVITHTVSHLPVSSHSQIAHSSIQSHNPIQHQPIHSISHSPIHSIHHSQVQHQPIHSFAHAQQISHSHPQQHSNIQTWNSHQTPHQVTINKHQNIFVPQDHNQKNIQVSQTIGTSSLSHSQTSNHRFDHPKPSVHSFSDDWRESEIYPTNTRSFLIDLPIHIKEEDLFRQSNKQNKRSTDIMSNQKQFQNQDYSSRRAKRSASSFLDGNYNTLERMYLEDESLFGFPHDSVHHIVKKNRKRHISDFPPYYNSIENVKKSKKTKRQIVETSAQIIDEVNSSKITDEINSSKMTDEVNTSKMIDEVNSSKIIEESTLKKMPSKEENNNKSLEDSLWQSENTTEFLNMFEKLLKEPLTVQNQPVEEDISGVKMEGRSNFAEENSEQPTLKQEDLSLAEKNKRHAPLLKLITDPNAKLDVHKTMENIGTVAKNSLEDKRAPMYHVRNMVGSAKSAMLSAMRIPPQDLIVPSQYKIVDSSKMPEQRMNNEVDPITSSVSAILTQEPKKMSLIERARQRYQERMNLKQFVGQPAPLSQRTQVLRQNRILKASSPRSSLEDDPLQIMSTFQKIGTALRESVVSGEETLQHLGNMVQSARKAFSTSRFSAPRVFLPYTRTPALLSRSNFGDEEETPVDKVMLVTPKILDVQKDDINNNLLEHNEQFVGAGEIMDALGISNPHKNDFSLRKIVIHQKPLSTKPNLLSRSNFKESDDKIVGNIKNKDASKFYIISDTVDPEKEDVQETLETLDDVKEMVGAKNLRDLVAKMKDDLSLTFSQKREEFKERFAENSGINKKNKREDEGLLNLNINDEAAKLFEEAKKNIDNLREANELALKTLENFNLTQDVNFQSRNSNESESNNPDLLRPQLSLKKDFDAFQKLFQEKIKAKARNGDPNSDSGRPQLSVKGNIENLHKLMQEKIKPKEELPQNEQARENSEIWPQLSIKDNFDNFQKLFQEKIKQNKKEPQEQNEEIQARDNSEARPQLSIKDDIKNFQKLFKEKLKPKEPQEELNDEAREAIINQNILDVFGEPPQSSQLPQNARASMPLADYLKRPFMGLPSKQELTHFFEENGDDVNLLDEQDLTVGSPNTQILSNEAPSAIIDNLGNVYGLIENVKAEADPPNENDDERVSVTIPKRLLKPYMGKYKRKELDSNNYYGLYAQNR